MKSEEIESIIGGFYQLKRTLYSAGIEMNVFTVDRDVFSTIVVGASRLYGDVERPYQVEVDDEHYDEFVVHGLVFRHHRPGYERRREMEMMKERERFTNLEIEKRMKEGLIPRPMKMPGWIE